MNYQIHAPTNFDLNRIDDREHANDMALQTAREPGERTAADAEITGWLERRFAEWREPVKVRVAQ